jgi:hypothetical protein
MRKIQRVLDDAPYVGAAYLGSAYRPDSDTRAETMRHGGNIDVQTPGGHKIRLGTMHGSSWAMGFRKEYWYEVGGYSEDDIYGDLPFINKGWFKGYLSAYLEEGPFASDLGHKEGTRTTVWVNNICNHYPRLFNMDEATLKRWHTQRHVENARRNHESRAAKFNEYGADGWREYMKEIVAGESVNWDKFAETHSRFLNRIRKDHNRVP